MSSLRLRGLESKEQFKDILAYLRSSTRPVVSIESHGDARSRHDFEATITFRCNDDDRRALTLMQIMFPGVHADRTFLGMTVLVNPSPERQTLIDIVAVHGLTGHAATTWTSDNSRMWIRDFIPLWFSNARVMSFGYESSRSIGDVKDVARQLLNGLMSNRQNAETRPVVFLAHSLGGLVVKQALVMSASVPTYKDIHQQVRCITFFGTPHRGSPVANWASWIFRALPTFCRPNALHDHIKKLRRDSKFLFDLGQRFLPVLEASHIKVLSVYELNKIKKHRLIPFVPGFVIVRQNSALLGLEDSAEVAIAINACHREICRFPSEHSRDFQDLMFQIRETLGWNEYLPRFGPNNLLVGRHEMIEDVYNICITSLQPTRSTPFCIALVGQPGIGKTSVARQVCNLARRRQLFGHIFFLSAESETKLVQNFKEILRLSNISDAEMPTSAEQIRELFFEQLKKADQPWLLVYDNAVEESFLSISWPVSGNGSVIVTSNSHNIAHGLPGTVRTVVVAGLSQEHGAELLISKVPCSHSEAREVMWPQCVALAQRFDGLPLVLRQLGAFMHCANITPRQVVQLLDKPDGGNGKIYFYHDKEKFEERQGTLEDAWAAIFPRLSTDSTKLLNILSLLDRERIPAEMFPFTSERPPYQSFEFLFDEFKFLPAKGSLVNYEMVSIGDSESISLHPAVQITLLNRMSFDERTNAFRMVLWLLRRAYPHQDMGAHMHNVWDTCEVFVPQVLAFEKAVAKWKPVLDDMEASEYTDLICDTAWYLWEVGQHEKGMEILDSTERSYLKSTGSESIQAARICVIQGSIYSALNRYDKSGPLFLEGLRLHQKLLPADHPLIANSLMQAGNYYTSQEKFDKAIESHRSALQIRQRAHNTPPDMTALSYLNICRPLLMTNKPENLDEAEAFLTLAEEAENCLDHRLLLYYKSHIRKFG
ncbi:hypothetical protein QBC36DRAFT_365743 [Triangularia setosa]|uniref:AAA+ ATPase domain-containing protein n=1 Tax=Triangularia setosa TaxID=2587417 RepID=A0AAN6WBR3_9PEZI|nr:hypothetical protein QBC36DRAFT_365743 [Podospora setosa]